MSWFTALAIDDQIRLLRDPRHRLRPQMASHIALSIGEQPGLSRRILGRRVLHGSVRSWLLAEPAARHLCDARKKLDAWWDSEALAYGERKHLIQHRWDDELPAHSVMVDTALLRVYLEMKAP